MDFEQASTMIDTFLVADEAGNAVPMVKLTGPLPHKLEHTWRLEDLRLAAGADGLETGGRTGLQLRVRDTPGPRNNTPSPDAVFEVPTRIADPTPAGVTPPADEARKDKDG